jgi:Flp pilus assembly pilin Flp
VERRERVGCERVKEWEMSSLLARVKRFAVAEDGPTTVEYGVMLALIVLASVVAIALIGQKVSSTFSTVDGGLPDGS